MTKQITTSTWNLIHKCKHNTKLFWSHESSVCKSSLITGKRLEPDWTRTYWDCKLVGLFRTITAVQSTVHYQSTNLKTKQRPVLTGLSSLKVMLAIGLQFLLLTEEFFRWEFDQLWHDRKMPNIIDLNLQLPPPSSIVPTTSLWPPAVI